MNPLDYKPLVYKIVRKYAKELEYSGNSFEDGIQCAFIGVLEAMKVYKGSEPYPLWSSIVLHARRELQRLMYTDVKTRSFRRKESPVSNEVAEGILDGRKRVSVGSRYEVEDFISKLPIYPHYRVYLMDHLDHSHLECGKRYQKRNQVSRMMVSLMNKSIKQTLGGHYERIKAILC